MNKTRLSAYIWIVAVLLTFGPVRVGAEEMTLDEILNQMDRVGSSLNSMRAEIHQKKWTEILEEFDEGESGQFSFLRTPEGAFLRKDIESPTVNSLVIREGQVLFFQPSIKQAQRYDLGGHGDKAEFLLLGFGSDKEALREGRVHLGFGVQEMLIIDSINFRLIHQTNSREEVLVMQSMDRFVVVRRSPLGALLIAKLQQPPGRRARPRPRARTTPRGR